MFGLLQADVMCSAIHQVHRPFGSDKYLIISDTLSQSLAYSTAQVPGPFQTGLRQITPPDVSSRGSNVAARRCT